MANLSGTKLGPYRIGERFGSGGMAEIYSAFDKKNSQQAVLKTIHEHLKDKDEIKKRFQREVQTSANLKHDNIIPIYYAGNLSDGRPYVIMPYIEGGSLEQWIQQGRFQNDPQRAISIIAQVASALDYAHSQGVIHRDIKPANILLTSEGFALLTDFGIAKVMQAQTQITNPGEPPGTPAYMAPEQIKGRDTGAETDVYALGIVLFEALTGRLPFEGDTNAIIYQQVNEPPPSVQSINPNLPATLDKVIQQAMAKEPAKRYHSAAHFASDVQRALQGEHVTTYRGQTSSGIPFPVLIIGVIVILAAGFGLFLTTQNSTDASATPTSSAIAIDSTPTPSPTLAPIDVGSPGQTGPTPTPNQQLSLSSPSNNASFEVNDRITLTWDWPSSLSSGEEFRLVVQGSQGVVVDEALSEAQYSFSPSQASQYNWLVVVSASAGTEIARSAPSRFVVNALPTPIPVATTLESSGGTDAPTPTPIVDPPTRTSLLPAPRLISPGDGAGLTGLTDVATLRWSSADLRDNEYYVVLIKHRVNTPAVTLDRYWTKSTSVDLSQARAWLIDNPDDLFWQVVVAKADTDDPNGTSETHNGKEVSAYSDEYRFGWQR